MNKNAKTVLTVVIVLVVFFLVALPKLSLFEDDEKPASQPNEAGERVIPVTVKVVEQQTLNNEINITGEVLANESIELASDISGKISGIYFKEGEQVKKGDLLLRINDDDLRAQLEKLKYTKQLNVNMESRMSQLLERDAISQEEYDITLTELNTSSADIEALEVQIGRATIRAPFSGVIGLRYVSEGSYITPTTPIATLYNVDPAKIQFSVPGKYVKSVDKGDKIRFTAEGRDEVFSGEVYATEPKIDPLTRTLTVRANSPNKDKRLIPGQFVRVSLSLENREEAIMIPSMSLIPEANGHLVFLLRDGRADSVKVKIGTRNAQEVEIISGINPGDSLVISGIQQIKDGVRIKAM